jgi:hypothetical protein
MADEVAKGDQNNYRVIQAVTNDSNQNLKNVRLDPTTLALLVSGVMTASGYTTVTSGTFTTTGTAGAQLVSISTPCKKVTITVPTSNTGQEVCVGGSNVSAVLGSEIGHILITGSSQDFYIADASSLYVSLNIANDKVAYNIWN